MLNPRLYAALKKRFGAVRLAHENVQRRTSRSTDPLRPDRVKDTIVVAGEQYNVRCPYCEDKGQHLSISYLWGTRTGGTGGRALYLARCWRKECQRRPEFDLEGELRGCGSVPIAVAAPQVLDDAPLEFRSVTFPGVCKPLASLPEQHIARLYVENRGFSAVQLSRFWGLHYCAAHESSLVRNRLIIPVFWDNKMVGWQARSLGQDKLKYYTMPGLPKGRLLFNGERAAKQPVVVLVEGVFDAFRVGTAAAALLGKAASAEQIRLIRELWGAKTVIICLDPDALDEGRKLLAMLGGPRAFKGGACVAAVPAKDPAEAPREVVWNAIRQEAAKAGVRW